MAPPASKSAAVVMRRRASIAAASAASAATAASAAAARGGGGGGGGGDNGNGGGGGENDNNDDEEGVLLPAGAAGEAPSFLFRHFFHSDARLSKLFSHEDAFHVHKTLGALAICSFAYRYAVVFPREGTLGFEGSRLDWATMLVHLLLALSASFFRVPAKRLPSKPLMIYEEYRQHAMVFSLRTFSTFSLAVLFPRAPDYAAPLLTLAHHLVVDRITALHGNGSTAVRVNSARLPTSTFYKRVALLYSFYQFLAIGAMIVPSARRADMAYNAIIAITSSAFLMTLYKKRIIRGRTHLVVYSACLALSAFHFARVLGAAQVGLIVATFALRVGLPSAWSSKYALWALYCVATHFMRGAAGLAAAS